jgi:hypothetical protein
MAKQRGSDPTPRTFDAQHLALPATSASARQSPLLALDLSAAALFLGGQALFSFLPLKRELQEKKKRVR